MIGIEKEEEPALQGTSCETEGKHEETYLILNTEFDSSRNSLCNWVIGDAVKCNASAIPFSRNL